MKGKLRPILLLLAVGILLRGPWLSASKAADAPPPEANLVYPSTASTTSIPSTPSTPSIPQPTQPFTVQLPANVSLELTPIKAGTFLMGSPDSEENRLVDEGPPHKVTISRDFWLGKYPVTQAQYLALVGTNPSVFTTDSNLPVECVSWEESVAFCKALTDQEKAAGRLPEGYAYQLPTEAQWEYACRAGTTTAYPGDLDEITWYDKNSDATTHPVGQKKPNAWGLYDMTGNVRQWCADWYGPYSSDPATDPTGAGRGMYRLIRGGSWFQDARYSRSAARYSAPPGITGGSFGIFRLSYLGFRIALAPAPKSGN